MGILEAFWYLEFFQQSTAVKRFNRKRRKPPYPERKLLQWRVGICCFLQYQDGTFRHGQLTGKKKSDRAGPGEDDVVSRLMLIVTQKKAPET